MTLLNVLKIRIDVSAGNIISAEIKSAPMSLIPSTIVTAVRIAIIIL